MRDFLSDKSEKNQLKKVLYKYIHRQGRTSKAELLKEFHVPNTTMTRMLAELTDRNLIHQAGFGQPTGGRPPVLYESVPNAAYLIGVEIARTDVRVMLLNLHYEIIGKDRFPFLKLHTPQVTIASIIDMIDSLMNRHQISSLLGIGIGAVGPIDRENGVILNPESFPAEGWKDVQIGEILHKRFSVPVILNNGANTGVLAEYYIRNDHEENILYCISGYGIRCGYIQEGRLFNQKQGDATSYEHIIIEADGRDCTCGSKGCLKAYVSFEAMLNHLASKGRPSTIDDLFNNKEPLVREIIMESAHYYGIGIANMIQVLHPDTVVLHGTLMYHDAKYYDKVLQSIQKHIGSRLHGITIRKGVLGENATSIGAAIQVFDHFFE
ncbi:ROK family transcriptional regulator [Bacillus sp. SD088]|uniref:ROK family transcriptional regulator n=1 Tax=Bacillus sp. SD088 TaxID=2782012 RepID=UPI001A95EE17|nr:ROK family transcriptional regulator [Bacillus sp. SD088]MBO0995393.1 ROK family transcriptional regulator [Bacillus sp. SD088]